eukprot:scaffold110_cov89-Skeletonema_dohrnii-CCMP3373.AAC.5
MPRGKKRLPVAGCRWLFLIWPSPQFNTSHARATSKMSKQDARRYECYCTKSSILGVIILPP